MPHGDRGLRARRPPASSPTNCSSSACIASAWSGDSNVASAISPGAPRSAPVGRTSSGVEQRTCVAEGPAVEAAVRRPRPGRRGRGRGARPPGPDELGEVAQPLAVVDTDGVPPLVAFHHLPSRDSVARCGPGVTAGASPSRSSNAGVGGQTTMSRRASSAAAPWRATRAAAASPARSRRARPSAAGVRHGVRRVRRGSRRVEHVLEQAPASVPAGRQRPSSGARRCEQWRESTPIRRAARGRRRPAAASTSPAASSASTRTVSSSAARRRSVADDAQTAAGGGPAELVVPAGEVQAGRRQQRLKAVVLPRSSCSASASRPCRIRRSARRSSGASWDRHLPRTRRWRASSTASASPHRPSSTSNVACTLSQWLRQEGRPDGRGADQPSLAQQLGPGVGAREISGVVTGGEERAHRLADDRHVVAPARTPAPSPRRAAPSLRRCGPACTWASPASAIALVSRLTSPNRRARSSASSASGQQLHGVVDVAPHPAHGDPALLDARRLVSDQPRGPGEPGPAGGQVPEAEGVELTEAGAARSRHSGCRPLR